ncbi:MAG: MlaD family protein [Planctomycetota bacterium]
MASKGAEVRVGLVVIGGLAVLGLGLFLVSGGAEQFKDKTKYTILFKNAGGLNDGDSVTVAGRKAGSVLKVVPTRHEIEGKAEPFLKVTILVLSDAEIQTDSRIAVQQTITGIKTLAISSGKGENVKSDSLLFGERLATFEEVIDQASDVFEEAEKAVETLHKSLRTIDKIVMEVDEKDVSSELASILESLRKAADNIESVTEQNEKPISEAIAHLEEATKDFNALLTDVRREWDETAKDRIGKILKEIEEASEKVNAVVTENRPIIKATLQGFRDATLRVAPTLERIQSLSRNLDETVILAQPKLVQTLENARQAMKKFEETIEDLKTAPWKLINKPSDKESREVHIYNAARLYTSAVGDLSIAIDDLETLRRLGLLTEKRDSETVESVMERLKAAVEAFNKRQAEFVDLLTVEKARK